MVFTNFIFNPQTALDKSNEELTLSFGDAFWLSWIFFCVKSEKKPNQQENKTSSSTHQMNHARTNKLYV